MPNLLNAKRVPAGLIDQHCEIFLHPEQGLKAIHNGNIIDFSDLPKNIKFILQVEMECQPEVLEVLENYGIPADDQLEVYAKCRYGNYNLHPDITEEGITQHEHCLNCSGNCCLSPLYRGRIEVANGMLTQREIEVAVAIASADPGKSIADRLGMCESTLHKHKHSIFQKTGYRSNVELAVWVTQNLI
jgi:DNA-binding CsgD family transcriptional regulator